MECRVCEGPANGFHYKISACRACAAFFRRTVQMKLRYKCRKIGEYNRFCCRYCRMKKCMAVGMTIEEVEVSSEFHLDQPSTSELPNFRDDEFFAAENILKCPEEFTKKLKGRLYKILSRKYEMNEGCFDMYLIQQAEMAYRIHEEKWPCSKETLKHDVDIDMNLMVSLNYRQLLVTAEICTKIKPFSSLPLDQKAILFKLFYLKFIQLDRTAVTVELLGDDRDDSRCVTLNGQTLNFHKSKFDLSMVTDLNQEQLKDLLLCSEVRYDNEFIKPFKLLKPDRFERLYLMMRSMWDVKGHKGISKETEKLSETIMEKLSDELHFYYKYEKQLQNPSKRIYKLQILLIALDRVAAMRKQDFQMSQMFEMFKLDVYLSDFTID